MHKAIYWPYSLQITQPILFLSGLQDEMVPPFHMQMLYAKAAARNRRCIFVEFPTGMHMDTWLAGGDNYWKTIQLFFEQNVPEQTEIQSSHNDNGNNSPKSYYSKHPTHPQQPFPPETWFFCFSHFCNSSPLNHGTAVQCCIFKRDCVCIF